MITHIVSNSGLTVVFDDGPRMIHKSSPGYASALEALASQDTEGLRLIMDPRHALSKFSNGDIAFNVDGSISVDSQPIGEHCSSLLIAFQKNKLPWEGLAAYISNRAKNPSERAKLDLDAFLKAEELPITNDGCFLALKLFTNDWIDSDTGDYIGAPGKSISFPREKIDRKLKRGAEKGFSAGSKYYVDYNSTFVGKTVIVKINPADVIGTYTTPVREAICCKYTIVKETSSFAWGLLHNAADAEAIVTV